MHTALFLTLTAQPNEPKTRRFRSRLIESNYFSGDYKLEVESIFEEGD